MFTESPEASAEQHMQSLYNIRPGLDNEASDHQLADNEEENCIKTYHIFLQEYREQCELGAEWSLQHRHSLLSTLNRCLNPEKQLHYSDNYLKPHRQVYKPGRRSFQSRGRLEMK